LGRDPATISRELRRNQTGSDYHAAQAEQQARVDGASVRWSASWKIRSSTPSSPWSREQWAPEKLRSLRQQHPDQGHVSPQTIYTWIAQSDDRKHWNPFCGGAESGPFAAKRGHTSCAARIDQRPEVIEQRLRLGDFEGDTVLGPPGTGGLATLVDRKSRYTIVVKINPKTPTTCMRS